MVADYASATREVLKLVVISAYVIFALILLVGGNPLALVPLLPWALKDRLSLRARDLPSHTKAGRDGPAL